MNEAATRSNESHVITCHDNEKDEEDKIFKFDPPLYIQRYRYISKLIEDFNSKTYLDIGWVLFLIINSIS